MSVCGLYVTPLFCGFFKNVLLLPYITANTKIDQLQKDFLGKSYEMTLIAEFAILAH